MENEIIVTMDTKHGEKMKRGVGLVSAIGMIVGTIIGSGIFVSPKGVLEGCGSPGLSLLIWAACGCLSTMGALVYAELGTAVPRSGGEHAYLMYTFKGDKSDLGRLPAFLFDWVGLFIIRPTMVAGISLSMGTYIVRPFYPCGSPPNVTKLVTFLGMLLITFINCYSVRLATRLQNVTTAMKLLTVLIIAVGGLYQIGTGNAGYITDGFEGTVTDPSTVLFAFYNGLWAFDGWNTLNFMTEELKNPSRNLPLAIIIGIPVTTVCYVLVNIGYFSALTKYEMVQSHTVAVVWGEKMLGIMAWCMPVFVALSAFGSVNGCLFSSGRLCFVAGRDHHLPRVLSYIHYNKFTPVPAMLFTLLMSTLLLIPGDISSLISFFSFASWAVYGLTSISLILLRFTDKRLKRPYKVPIVIPIILIVASGYFVVTPFLNNSQLKFHYAIVFMLSGIVVFVPFVHMKIKFAFIDHFSRLCQKLLLIVPTMMVDDQDS